MRHSFEIRLLARRRAGNAKSVPHKAVLGDTEALFFDGLVRWSDRDRYYWFRPRPALARALAAVGDDAAARQLVMVSRTQLAFRAIATRAIDRINGEISVSLARAGESAQSIAALGQVRRSSWRVWYLSHRRRLYHAHLSALRLQSAPGTDAQRSAALDSLRLNQELFGISLRRPPAR